MRYIRLQDVLHRCKTHDTLIVTGDMNAKVGDDNQTYERVMKKHGIGQRNDNGERMCDMNELMKHGIGQRNDNGDRMCDMNELMKHGIGQRNDTGDRMCDMNELLITGTLFPHKAIHKATWASPDGVTRTQIDHILISRRFRNSLKDTRVFRSADIGSDHFSCV